jgi:DNA-binding transcriptional regulator YiaG
MPAYNVQYETGVARCAWCWKPLPAAEPHAVVMSVRPPLLRLEFHNPCWVAYSSVSGIELGPVGSSKDWTPEKVEGLRIATGLSIRAICRQIGLSETNYTRYLQGEIELLGPGVLHKVRKLAAVTRYESKSPIDWSDPRALFCLRMSVGMAKGEFARAIGSSDQQVSVWDRNGVPQRSIRVWGRLTKLAVTRGFDASQVVDDRLWTSEFLQRAIAASGKSLNTWGAAAGRSYQAIQQ